MGWEEAEGSAGADPVVCGPTCWGVSLILRLQGAPAQEGFRQRVTLSDLPFRKAKNTPDISYVSLLAFKTPSNP